MEGETIYGIENGLKLCKDRLNRDKLLSKEAKDAILDFVDELAVRNVSDHVQYSYIERLMVVARIMGSAFLRPTRLTVKEAMLGLRGSKSRRNKYYSEGTLNNLYSAMKRFYSIYKDGAFFNTVSWIEIKTNPSNRKKPEDIVSLDELNKLINACLNERDKSLISLLYDSGCRIGELLTLRVKDIEYDDYGIRLTVNGKTGVRKVRVVGNSVSFAHDYQEKFNRKNPDDFFFVKMRYGGPMKWADVNTMLYKVSRRAGIKRRIHPHLFRHTRATLLAKDLKEAPLESTMGWVHGSRMSRVYVHLSDEQIDNAVLKVYGIEKRKENDVGAGKESKVCYGCKEINPAVNEYCYKCGMPLDFEKFKQMEESRRRADNSQMLAASSFSVSAILKGIDGLPESQKAAMLSAIVKALLEENDRKTFRSGLPASEKKKKH
ncbi:MAG: site-specific integrase [Candidatus Micrarchaeaceae archaeon]